VDADGVSEFTFNDRTSFGGGGEIPTPRPLGGVLVPMNKIAIVVPYLALIRLVQEF
jgi:hypothetical protein